MTAVGIHRPTMLWSARLAPVVAVIGLASAALAAAAQPKNRDAVIEKVRGITAGVLGVSADKLGDDTRLGSLPRPADDLDVVEIVLALEEAFTIEIPDAEFERACGGRAGERASLSRNLTVSKLAALVQKQLEQKAKVKHRGSRRQAKSGHLSAGGPAGFGLGWAKP